MSGSPPPQERREPSQLAGQRRKRSDSPPVTTAAAVATTPLLEPQGYLGSSFPEARPPPASRSEQQIYTPGYPIPQSYSYGAGPAVAGSAPASIEAPSGPGQLSPKASRKTKAHVASACINCKKKHLRCDSARPCRRCVQGGKESSCVDVEHKKRGRPPLSAAGSKADDVARQHYDVSTASGPGSLTGAGRTLPPVSAPPYAHMSQVYHRDIRPIQTQDLPRPGMRPGAPPQPMYAAPTVAPSSATAMGTIVSSRHYSTDLPSGSSQPPMSYLSSPPGYSPMSSNIGSRSPQHQWGGYPNPPPQQGSMMPPSQPSYFGSIFPRTAGPPATPPEPPVGMYGTSSLQLPPIRPAPPGSYTEPALAQQQRQYDQQPTVTQETTRQPDPKRPRMDIKGILDPRSD